MWGSGSPKREFLHFDDLASAVIFCFENLAPNSINTLLDENGIPLNYLNIGNGKDIIIKELSSIVAELINYR